MSLEYAEFFVIVIRDINLCCPLETSLKARSTFRKVLQFAEIQYHAFYYTVQNSNLCQKARHGLISPLSDFLQESLAIFKKKLSLTPVTGSVSSIIHRPLRPPGAIAVIISGKLVTLSYTNVQKTKIYNEYMLQQLYKGTTIAWRHNSCLKKNNFLKAISRLKTNRCLKTDDTQHLKHDFLWSKKHCDFIVVLLPSAHVERVSVSRMRDLSLSHNYTLTLIWLETVVGWAIIKFLVMNRVLFSFETRILLQKKKK